MRIALLAALLGVIAPVVAGCGGQHRAAPPPRWVQRASAVCRPIDRRIYANGAIFDSEAMLVGLRREATGLERVGFFRHVPAAALDLESAGRLLIGGHRYEFRTQRRADELLIRARRLAAHKGVHCAFAAFPLQNL